ncbi:helix-turn-helix domain-containing protein [Psychrobacter sp. AOP30-A2-5]|uniref:helix-turn-helix domain-containing protein n=1 Tax=Psychrobacter sp. AOP30-A2-5 TaxID=3457697 RepID=UPI0040356058
MNTQLISPIQPYFILDAQNSYQKKEINRDGIAHFYCFTLDKEGDAVSVVPDASIDIIFKLHKDKPEAWACGSWRKLGKTVFEHGCSYFGIRYQIGIVPSFLSIKPGDIIDQSIPLQDVSVLGTSLVDRLSDCQSFEQQISVFQQICSQKTDLLQSSKLYHVLIKLMLKHHGNISITELCHQSGYSARTIGNSFNDYYGFSPKACNLILRYQHVLDRLMQNDCKRLTDLAIDTGYSDQAHFFRQFKQYNGQGPREFQHMLNKYTHRA